MIRLIMDSFFINSRSAIEVDLIGVNSVNFPPQSNSLSVNQISSFGSRSHQFTKRLTQLRQFEIEKNGILEVQKINQRRKPEFSIN